MTTDRTSNGTFYFENLLMAELDHPLFQAAVDFVYTNKNRTCTIKAATTDKEITEVFVIVVDVRQLHSDKVIRELKEFKKQIFGFWISRYRMIKKLLGTRRRSCEFYPEFLECHTGPIKCNAGVGLTTRHECSKEASHDCPHAQLLRDRGDVYIMCGQPNTYRVQSVDKASRTAVFVSGDVIA